MVAQWRGPGIGEGVLVLLRRASDNTPRFRIGGTTPLDRGLKNARAIIPSGLSAIVLATAEEGCRRAGCGWDTLTGSRLRLPVTARPVGASVTIRQRKRRSADQQNAWGILNPVGPGVRQNLRLTPPWTFQRESALLGTIREVDGTLAVPSGLSPSGCCVSVMRVGLTRPAAS